MLFDFLDLHWSMARQIEHHWGQEPENEKKLLIFVTLYTVGLGNLNNQKIHFLVHWVNVLADQSTILNRPKCILLGDLWVNCPQLEAESPS